MLCPTLRGPLGTLQESFKAKNENLKISPVFPSKIEPWRPLAVPGPSQRALLGPDQVSRGPPKRLSGRPMHLSGPSLNAPGNPTGPNSKKIAFFFEIAKTTINVSSGALQGKRQVVPNRVFRPLEAPWSPPGARTLFFKTPPEHPRACFGAPGAAPNPPKSAQEPPRATSNSQS